MVNHDDIGNAPLWEKTLDESHRLTSAKLALVVLPKSSSYHTFMILLGLSIGSFLAIILWCFDITKYFPLLLSVQFLFIALFDLLNSLSTFSVRFIPKSIRTRTARGEALRQYHRLHAHHPKEQGFVLLFVSKGERYVHVLTNPLVHQRIPGDWEKVTDTFTQLMRSQGLTKACQQTLLQIAEILASSFPIKS